MGTTGEQMNKLYLSKHTIQQEKKNVTDVYNIDEFEMHFSKWKISGQKGFYVIPFIYFFKICKTIRQTKVQWLSVAGDGKQGLTVKGCE